MRRTTVFADDEVLGALQAIARRRGVTLSEVTREALATYVARSGRKDVAERAEEFLQEGFGR